MYHDEVGFSFDPALSWVNSRSHSTFQVTPEASRQATKAVIAVGHRGHRSGVA